MKRLNENPLLSRADLAATREDFEVFGVFNPAAVRVGGQTILLVRVAERPIALGDELATASYDVATGAENILRIRRDDPDLDAFDPRVALYRAAPVLTSLSHIRVARSSDGVNFTFDPAAAIYPDTAHEAFGCEDPRITSLDGRYYVTYTAVSEWGVCVALAVTEDFLAFEKLGVILPTPNKDACIFPEKIDGMYVCRHRPLRGEFGSPCIWTARSPDLLHWGGHQWTMAPLPGGWQGQRVGAGAPPIRTRAGWLEIFHAADAAGRYCLGAMLSDLERPERVLHRATRPVLAPQAEYERIGVYGECVFSNGLVADERGRLTVYYGAADSVCAAAVTTVKEMIAAAGA